MDQLIDQQRERIQADLRGLVAGDVRCDDVFVQLYASDGSIYQVKPVGVVRPRSLDDVIACVQYASDKKIPIHARGAGTGLAGESLGQGLIVDFSRHFRRIVHTGAGTVRVQAGVVHERLNAHLGQSGRMFAPDPPGAGVSTIGGVIAVDGSGSHWLKYGPTRDHVIQLRIVLADGEVLDVGREPLDAESPGATAAKPRKRRLIEYLARLLGDNAELIRSKQPDDKTSQGGFRLAGVLQEGHLDLAKLLAGSEGTLALVTEALLATEPVPRHRGVALLLFESLHAASRAVTEILPHQPSACDLIDRRHLSLAREAEVRFDLLVPQETEAVLLVELDGEDARDVADRMHKLVDRIWHRKGLAFGARQAFDREETELFWQLGARLTPSLLWRTGSARPLPVVEDVTVPPAILPEFLVQMQNILKRYQVTASLFAHAGQGQLHIQPFLDLSDTDAVGKMRWLAGDLYQAALDAGGTVSGEHTSGLSGTPSIRRRYGELYEVFREVKRAFDPENLLNPGRIVSDQSPLAQPMEHLRPAVVPPQRKETPGDGANLPEVRNLLELQLRWDPVHIVDAARRCNGCGVCRTQGAGARMCPIFRILPSEEAAPRAKANLVRGILANQLELGALTHDELKSVLDLCVHCHMCRLECPLGVDIPKLMVDSKGAYVTANGLPFSDWVLTRLDLLASWASLIRPAANWALGNAIMRWVLEKTLGIARQRKLPRVTRRSFLRRAARRRLTRPTRRSGRKVLYFADTYANYFDPALGEALVAVLEHNGVAVYVHPKQRAAGMPAVACGALDRAVRLARANVAILADAVRQGYHIVATEPSAALCLTREYVHLLDDDEARLVAANSSEATTFLWRLHTAGQLQLDFKPLHANAGYHMPCHLKALEVGAPGVNLLRLVPGLLVQQIEEGCSGMAGTFGMKQANYRNSLRAGWRLITRMRDATLQIGITECSTCKMQMEQGTTKPTIHPVKLLALAYGLMPEMAGILTARGREHVVT